MRTWIVPALVCLWMAAPLVAESAPSDDLLLDRIAECAVTQSLAEDAVAAQKCFNRTAQTTLCIGTNMCKGAAKWSYPQDGGCGAGETLTALGSVPDACQAAKDVTDPAPCNTGNNCQSVDVQEEVTQTATCCTVKKTRICQPIE